MLDFDNLLRTQDWVQELGGLLPLSALLDFLDASRVFHMYQLTGTTAWWCWPITPAGSRMLLSRSTTDQTCLLDDFDPRTTPICLDGRYGDKYPMANPETLRLCLATVKPQHVENTHKNLKRKDIRPHTIDLVHVKRRASDLKKSLAPDPFGLASRLAGWVVWAAMVAFSVISTSWLLLTFLLLVTTSGVVVSRLFPAGPRDLRVDRGSNYNRLVLSAQHMNATHWTIYYGESSVVNSFLNWPLRLEKRPETDVRAIWLKRLLRVLILGQWAMTVGAAALKDWNAYGISFWILFCIVMNAWSFATERSAGVWLGHAAVALERYTVEVSSRRALLNLVLALNPDTFARDKETDKPLVGRFSASAVLWMNDILKAGESRSRWEEASRLAMIDSIHDRSDATIDEKRHFSQEREEHSKEYWVDFIDEGIQVSQRLRQQARLGGHLVVEPACKTATPNGSDS